MASFRQLQGGIRSLSSGMILSTTTTTVNSNASFRLPVTGANNYLKNQQVLSLNYCAATDGKKKKIKTFEYQKDLPKLPVAPLKPTMEKYLRTIRPLVNDKEFEYTKSVVAEFQKPGGMGEKLHKLLVERSNVSKPHWLEAWWDSYAYFAPRYPIIINVNYYFHYDLYQPGQMSQTLRAANIVKGALEFKRLLETEELSPDMQKDIPLDMSAYQWMFSTCRIPHEKEDFLKKYSNSKHILVARKNRFYTVDVLREDGSSYSIDDIEKQLAAVIKLADTQKPDEHSIGILTADDRTHWSNLREKILAVDQNKSEIERLQSSIFMVCLDSSSPKTPEEIGRQLWHGDGKNRFFDKSIQFIIFENGVAGLNGEHSKLDGMPVQRLSDFIMFQYKLPVNDRGVSLSDPKPVNIKLTPELKDAIQKSGISFEKFVSGFGLRILPWKKYGKNLMKKVKLSPDAYVQMAIQWAYYKMYGKVVATYESAQTKKYLGGRTEVGRVCSIDSLAWINSMASPTATPKERYELLKKACESHAEYMREACEGFGVDRLLLGLKMICLERGWELPSIFTDPAFSRGNNWQISTSQLSSDGFYVGFGPVVDDGFGVCYSIREESITMAMSAHAIPETNVDTFWKHLHDSLMELQTTCETARSTTAKL